MISRRSSKAISAEDGEAPGHTEIFVPRPRGVNVEGRIYLRELERFLDTKTIEHKDHLRPQSSQRWWTAPSRSFASYQHDSRRTDRTSLDTRHLVRIGQNQHVP